MTTTVARRPDGVAVLTMANPPVNSLSKALMTSFCENMAALLSDPGVKAVVVTGAGAFFCGGAAIDEMPAPGQKPSGSGAAADMMGLMAATMDAAKKPVVAAVNGMALGGGLEVALMCGARVFSAKAAVGLPEVNLGLLPGGQGTQRLPRVCGCDAALNVMLSGTPVPAAQAQAMGLADAVAPPPGLLDAAARHALSGAAISPIPQRPVKGAAELPAVAEKWAKEMAKKRRGEIAPRNIIAAVRAAAEAPSFADGVAAEKRLFMELMNSSESAALRFLFFAERAAGKLPYKDKALPIKSAGIIGSGTMGGGIAMCFANAGIPVVLVDAKQEFLDRGVAVIRQNYARKMQPAAIDKVMRLIRPTLAYEDLASADVVVEAVFEDLALKQDIFRRLDAVCKPSALLCTNTSGLDVDAIAAVTRRPAQVMGTHFFSPANVMRLLENVRGSQCAGATLVTMAAVGRKIGKLPVTVGNGDGFVGNRMMGPYFSEARMLLEEGLTPEQVDGAMTAWGFAMGPLATNDLIGWDVMWKARKGLGDMTKHTKMYVGPFDLMDRLCEAGHFGQKAGQGVYEYVKGKRGGSAATQQVVDAIRKAKGVSPREVAAEEARQRLLFGMINEGFQLLEEGKALRPSDIDVIFVNGYGFPKVKGGPMWAADNLFTLPTVLAKLREFDAAASRRAAGGKYKAVEHFRPSPLLEACVRDGLTLEQAWQRREKAKAKM